MSSGSSVGGTDKKPTVPKEYEEIEREAEVWLYDSEASALGLTFTYRHWILVFEFVDKSIRAIEGVNYKGTLLPSFTKVKDPSSRRVSRKGTIKISPIRIRELAKKNPHNGKAYDALACNCQSWLNWVLKELGFDEEITANSEVTWTVASVALGFLNPFIGVGTYVVRKTHNLIYNLFKD